MRNLFIARHGQDIDNSNGILNGRRDQLLTELGISQAINLALNIKKANLSFENIYSSPLIRAASTATIIADRINGPRPNILPDLIERDFGILTGMPYSQIPKYGKDILIAGDVKYFLKAQNAETFPQILERAKKVLTYLENQDSVLIVCHGDIGKMLYAAFYDLDWKKVLQEFHFGNADLLYLSQDDPPSAPHKFKFEQFNL